MELPNIPLNDSMSSISSVTVSLILAAMISVAFTVSTVMKKDNQKYPPFAPGGIMHHIAMVTSSQYPWWLLDVAKQLNTRIFQLSLPNIRQLHIVIGEPNLFRAVLTDPTSKKPLEIYASFRNMNGSGTPAMFTMNGPDWHSKRKSVAPAFSSNQIKRMNTVACEQCETWIQEHLQDENVGFDVASSMVDIVLSAICETAFDYNMSKEERDLLGVQLECSLVEFTQRESVNPFRKMGFFIPSRRRAFQAAFELKGLCLKMMDNYTENPTKTKNTIIQLIMESDAAFPNCHEKAAQLLEFLVAGFDTTAYSISWILLSLAQHKEEQTRLRESLRMLTPDTWNNCQELQWVIKEGMRLYPVASGGSIRTIGKDFTTNDGKLIPKGSNCLLPNMLLFRNPDIFPNPDAFVPSRWENPTRDQLDAFLPFSLGKQNCVGQSLAKAETTSIVARIISEYELTVDETKDPFTIDYFLTLKPIGAYLRARKV